jgi:hypothetical protein
MRHRILQAATDRAARFRPLMEELAAVPAAAAVVILNERSIPSPRGGLWYEAQVIRMRKLLAAGPRRRTRKRLLECDRMQGREQRQESTDSAIRIRGAAGF